MIVKFPDLDTLRLALTSGAVPADVAQKAAVAGFGERDQLWVESSAKLPAAAQQELKRLGALVCKASGAALSTEVSSWLELLPLVPDKAPLDTLEQIPVLFEAPGGEEMSRLVLEMLRLGNDRQSFRWLEKNGDGGHALLRVVGPPYYSLLRAIDQLGGPGVAPHAFLERAPGIWVELGYVHPLAANIRPPKGKLLLLRPPRHWTLIPDVPFRDVYEIVEFQLPDGGTRWRDSALETRLRVAPRLQQAGPAGGPELWVLRGEAIDELNRFVQNAEDQLLTRLAFAVGEKNGQTIVVLRVRQSKLPPPVVVLPAEAYKSYLKLPNLFLPAGCILHPPLRRDVVRRLLAEDVSQITWLAPVESEEWGVGSEEENRSDSSLLTPHSSLSFTPESLPEDVFRPLMDWVDYVLDRDKELLQAWVQATQFDFEPFVCNEDEPPRPKKPPAEKPRGHNPVHPRDKVEDESDATMFEPFEETPEVDEETALQAFAAVKKVEPSEIEKELRAVEEDFLALPGTLEDDAHQALWPRLADLSAQLKNKTEDASICWLNALWGASAEHNGAAGRWAAAWFRTEAIGAAYRQATGPREKHSWIARVATPEGVNREVSGDDLDTLLNGKDPSLTDVRALAAYIVWSARRKFRPAPLVQRLQKLQRFLEKHEKLLPVRACWLAWYHLVQLLDDDVLALARARDRLLERLFHNGLRPEQDLPSFLRFAGQPTSQRFRDVREWMHRLNDLAHRWIENQPTGSIGSSPEAKTGAYVDLIFAFGFARLGEQDASRQLLQQAEAVLPREKEGHLLLFQSFKHRIQQALDGDACRGPLPAEIMEKLGPLRQARKPNETDQAYVVDRLRAISHILEPEQTVVPYRHMLAKTNEIERVAAELPDISDRKEIADRLLALLKGVLKGGKDREARVKALTLALDQAPRIGEDFAAGMLDQALAAYDGIPDNADVALLKGGHLLLEKALFVAAHFNRVEHIHVLLARFKNLLRGRSQALLMEDIDKLIAHCFRGLRKLGMREEIDQLLAQISAVILQDKSPAALDRRKMAEDPGMLRSLLQIASGWYSFGRDDQAQTILAVAREVLFKHSMLPLPKAILASTYAATLGQAPVEVAKKGLEELFEGLEGITNMFSTNNFYSQLHLRVVEAALLAVVSDDFTQGTQARRWLDDDEYLVRRRIHDDHRKRVNNESN